MLTAHGLRPPVRQLLSRAPTTHASPTFVSRPRTRAFHATKPRQDALNAFLVLPHEMMSLIHMALPWYATLPLTAFLVRGFLVTTAGSWARSLTSRYIGLHPLRHAIALKKRDEIMKTRQFSHPGQAVAFIKKAVKTETSQLDKKWNCTLWGQVNWSLAQLPIFIAMAEVIRQMCNTRDGLLSMGLSAVGLQEKDATSVHGVSLATNPWFEPSLADGGMLWFPDLISADPTGILPYMVSMAMFTNIYFTKNNPGNHDKLPRTTRIVRRVLLTVSLLVGPLCQELPAALMLYWLSSTSSVILWNVWLNWKYPAPRGFMACSRPLQLLSVSRSRRV